MKSITLHYSVATDKLKCADLTVSFWLDSLLAHHQHAVFCRGQADEL